MASPRDNFKHASEFCAEFPVVPVRHKKILEKLARCNYCGRLCCCIEHCLMHENKHSKSERERKGLCVPNTPEWIDASEMAYSSRVVKNEFPFFCVYCKIKVKDEIDLRHLMTYRSLCPIKKCHWMIPLSMYQEDSKDEGSNDNTTGGNNGISVYRYSRFTSKKTPEKSLLRTALRNCLNMSLRTPPPVNFEETTNVTGPLTSTPESDTVSYTSLQADVSPTTPDQFRTPPDQPLKERAGILSTGQRTRIRPKGMTRRVTFACDPEIEDDINEGNANERENADTKKVSDERKDDGKCECKTFNDEGNKENIPLHHDNRSVSDRREKC